MTSTARLAFFSAGVLLILVVSLASLRARRRHALPRGLAFAAILGLVLLNAGDWLADPLSPLHLLSWVFLMASVPVVLYPLHLLHAHGRPAGSIDQTTALVERGIYRFIRHPLYLSLVLVALGALLKRVVPLTLALATASVSLLYLTARLEEAFNEEKFGMPCAEYRRRTKMFIPGLL